jgi:hypothetical protein
MLLGVEGQNDAMDASIEHRYEKYGAIALSRWFRNNGYEVKLSVPGPIAELRNRNDMGGIDPPDLSKFDTKDRRTRYTIYYDSPGHIDLVARNDDEVWIIEAKGLTEGRGAPGAVAEAIGQIILLVDPEFVDYRYGILLPKEERFTRVIEGISNNNPIMCRSDFHVLWVTEDGDIELDRRFAVG